MFYSFQEGDKLILYEDEEKQKRGLVDLKELEASENKKGFLFSTLRYSPGGIQSPPKHHGSSHVLKSNAVRAGRRISSFTNYY